MDELHHVRDFIDSLDEIDNVSELNDAFIRCISIFGLNKFTCLSIVDLKNPPPRSLIIFRFPEKWVQRYVDEEYYKYDIVLKTALNNIGPFLWRDLDTSDCHNRRIVRESSEFGINDGVSFPISLPGQYPACISIAGDHINISTYEFHALHLCAEHYYFELIRREGIKTRLFDPKILTQREAECLVWSAKGKTDYEIGRILSLSARTVNEYMGNIRRKLNVSTRTQAVALAVSGGLIAP